MRYRSAFAALLPALLAGCSLQMGEVAEVTARDATRVKSDNPFPGSVTRCEAHVDYTVDGRSLRAHDVSDLMTPGQPAENCPFAVGQSALVWVGSSPETTRVFTTSGRTWWLFGGLLLLPVMVGVRFLRGRSKES